MKEIESRSRTRMKVQREDDMEAAVKERYIDIVGARAEQKVALEMVLELATFCREDEGEVLKDTRAHATAADGAGDGEPQDPPLVFEVLPDEVGKVLGRKGETVKQIEKESGTKIELEKAVGKVEIYGRKEAQDKALELLLAEVSYAKAWGEGGEILKDQPRGRPAEGAPELPPPLKLWVRDREAGRVIGRGGETVREIMEKTGCDIKVQKAEEMRPGETDREIKIFGTEEQQQEALKLVLEEVTWANGANGNLKTPPEAELKEEKEKEEKVKVKERAPERKGGGDSFAIERRKPKTSADKEREQELARVGRQGAKDGGRRGGGAAWVCATCGGDHRTRECPHSTGLLGMGMQLGMQMGMQAMGMPLPMGMQGMPPMMGHYGGMMPGMPGMPRMLGLPGFPGCDESSDDSSGSSSSSSAGSAAGSRADSPAPPGGPGAPAGEAEAAVGMQRVRRRRKQRHGEPERGDGGRGSRGRAGAARGVDNHRRHPPGPPGQRRRRREEQSEGQGPLEDDGLEGESASAGAYVAAAVSGRGGGGAYVDGARGGREKRRRREASGSAGRGRAAAAAAALDSMDAAPRKKKIHMTDL